MNNYFISNQSGIENIDIFHKYSATQIIFPNLVRDYAEQVYKSVTLYTNGPRLSTYESVRHGKHGRVYQIRKNWSGRYDVIITDTIKVAGAEYETYVYTNSFPTLREAVKAKFRHYKD